MSQELIFNFDDLTIGDLVKFLRAAASNDTGEIVDIADRVTEGGVKHMSLRLYHNMMRQFGASFAAYMQQLADDNPDALRLIRQALDSDKE